jgi:hypothetical protein
VDKVGNQGGEKQFLLNVRDIYYNALQNILQTPTPTGSAQEHLPTPTIEGNVPTPLPTHKIVTFSNIGEGNQPAKALFSLPLISFPSISFPNLSFHFPKFLTNIVENLISWFPFFKDNTKVKGIMIAEKYLDNSLLKISNVKISKITRDTALISWQTNQYSFNNKVNYGATKSFGKEAWSNDYKKYHQVKLTKLSPDKRYYFEVMSQGKNYTYDSMFEFKTGK